MNLAITNIINISVAQTPAGLGAYNTSNLAIISSDTPGVSFGDDDYKIYKEPAEVATDFGSNSDTYKMALGVFGQAPNILAGGGYLVVFPIEPSETLAEAITRTTPIVSYFGVMSTQIESEADTLDAAAVIQTLNKVGFFVQRDEDEVETGGILDQLRTGGLYKSRGLYYGSDTDVGALVMQASYAGRALSVNFSGSRTTLSMNLKDLSGVQPDPSMTQSIYNKAKLAGADIYASIQGVPKVLSFGANKFFDQVYNLGWFVGALEVAGFNYLAQTATKVPQTEQGMDGLKGAYRDVCQQASDNLYVAPGRWTSPTTFGNQQDLLDNVAQLGYYIYSAPIASQLQVDREARVAPLVQIAIKEAGAIHSSSVLIYVNA